MQEIEIEFKNLLTKKEYQDLIDQLHLNRFLNKKQINYYFETEDFQLKQHQAALRIRQKDGKFQCTLKQPVAEGLLETHDWLTEEEFLSWKSGNIQPKQNVGKQLKKLGIAPEQIKYQGNLVTYRIETLWENCTLVLDHSKYHDQEDYELELEAHNVHEGKKVFESLLSRFNIPKRATPNKIQRFFNSR
ncbi:MAG: CYTH domain-containing protein [Bacillaceae bacterium]|nr:CYTH domain-containing protein [Bacillaceae bacterium]